ncbi:PPR_2 domain-containing protein [Cephalotus follicularis]|uniref:PPR_2 domain-containing protein n=1 Tax=Cephalotus follicularis TaxID=3775 RepID=A0A1Q3B5P4_CEPFO|nr:PPR_2 domain-containing protein [Cephalotus follicularis]
MFSSLAVKRLHPDVITCTIMINGLCKEGLPNEAYDLFRKMEDYGCVPNSCSYNTIIKGFFRNNDASIAMQLLEEMVNRGFSADVSTIEMILNLFTSDADLIRSFFYAH